MDDPPIYLKQRVGKQRHSTPQCPLVGDSEPKETGPLPTPKSRSLFRSVTVPTHIPSKNPAFKHERAYDAEHHATDKANDSRTKILEHQSPLPKHPQPNVRSVRSDKDGNGAHTPKDHKIQLLNGVTPTQFSSHPADFPFFRDQVRTHLESELQTPNGLYTFPSF